MPDPRPAALDEIDAKLDKALHTHDKIHHELFDEDTAQVGSLGDIVEKHAGDAVFLTPPEKSVGGADGGLADWDAEMLATDPSPDAGMDEEDEYSARDETEGLPATDMTGTVRGIARGFGTHLPQELGADGFQVEEMPSIVMTAKTLLTSDGELSDYDDNDDDGPDDPSPALARASQPFANAVTDENPLESDEDGGRIPIKKRRPHSTDDTLDATREIQ